MLTIIISSNYSVLLKEKSATTFGFCNDTNLLVDPRELLQAATAHSLPGLGICMSREELLLALGEKTEDIGMEDPAFFVLWCHTERRKGSRVI